MPLASHFSGTQSRLVIHVQIIHVKIPILSGLLLIILHRKRSLIYAHFYLSFAGDFIKTHLLLGGHDGGEMGEGFQE